MTTILIISVIYAALRAGHDSYLREGKWKHWASAQVLFTALTVSYLMGGEWPQMLTHTLLFVIIFWIVFDIIMGFIFADDGLYIGNTGFDKKVRATFLYTEKYRGVIYLLFKLFWLCLILGANNSISKL